MTEQETEIVEKLKFWKCEEYVTLHQACMLAINLDPYDDHGFDDYKDEKAPAPYYKLYTTIDSLINKEYFYTLHKYEKSNYEEESEQELYPSNSFFWPHSVIFNNDGLQGVSQIAIKNWLEDVGIDCPYYKALEIDNQQLTNPRIPSNHNTRLLGITDEVIERYYGDNFDPKNRDSITTQTTVVGWLVDNHSLSKRQAEAIDIITRPEIAKNPKGNS